MKKNKLIKYVRTNDIGYRLQGKATYELSVVGKSDGFYIFAPNYSKENNIPQWSKTINDPELHHDLHVALENYEEFEALCYKIMSEQPQTWVRV